MIGIPLFIFVLFFLAPEADAITRYADNTLSANCTSDNYSIADRTCTGSDGNAYTTIAGAVTPTVAGDTIYIRAGTWNERINVQDPNKSGAADAWITIAGYPGETVTIRYTEPTAANYGPIKARGNRGYFIFKNLILDGINMADENKWQIRDGNHHFTLEDIEMVNFPTSHLYIAADDFICRRCKLHLNTGPQGVGYGIYYHDGANGLVEESEIYDTDGGAIQAYPGPLSNITFRRNHFHDNNRAAGVPTGGILVGNSATPATVTNISIYDNTFANNGSDPNASTSSHGVRVRQISSAVTNVKIFNNVFYGNKTAAVYLDTVTSGIEVRNNVMTNNTGTELVLVNGASATITHNACTSSESCGATNKVTITSAADVMVDPVNGDFRLKQGTNALRDAGTSVTTRTDPIGTTDVGAFEQGAVSSAVAVTGYIDVTFNVMTTPLIPTNGITGFSVACVGCSGSPVVDQAVALSSSVVRLTVSGISASGTCTVSLGSTNLADSGYVGLSLSGISQHVNSFSGQSVTGTCQNTAGGGGPTLPGTPYIIYEFDDNLSDTSGNNLHASAVGTSFVAAKYYKGLKTDSAQDDYAEIPYFSGVNPTTQSLTIAGGVYIDPADICTTRAVGGTDPGTNQYFHLFYSGCTWKMLIQDNTSIATEFSVHSGWNHVCITFNAATDTATLYIDRVAGASSGASVQTYTSFLFAGNFRIGRYVGSGLAAGPNHIYDRWVVYQSVQDCTQIYDNWEPPTGTWTGTLSMVAARFYMAKADPSAAVIPLASANNTNITLPPGAALSVAAQTDCTTANCSAIGEKLYYTCAACPSAGTEIPVPLSASTDGIELWGGTLENGLLGGAHGTNLSGALTHVNGGTHTTTSSILVIDLPQNGSTVERWVVRIVAGTPTGRVYCFRPKEQTGVALNSYTPSAGICVTTGATSANSGP